MIEKHFKLAEHGTTISREILCGVTAFLTMSYILFLNPAIASEAGMPATGVFAATAMVAALCSFLIGIFANVPFGMAPGMGLNTFIAYGVCLGMGFKWQEALALVFISGLLHVFIMCTGLRKQLVNAMPQHLKMAFGAGLGLFIGYVGVKNAGFLSFTTSPGQYEILPGGMVVSNASIVPSLASSMGMPQVIAIIGLSVMMMLVAMERKTGESYAALPVGILVATFIGIPLGVTNLLGVKFIDMSAVFEIKSVFLAFWGDPGLLSLWGSTEKLLLSCLIITMLLVVNVMDSIASIIGIGQAQGAEIFNKEEMDKFADTGRISRLDKALKYNSLGGSLAGVMGTTTCTTYLESITGIIGGGRTGLAAVTIGAMFLLCLPLGNFFNIIPAVAIAPALIVAGAFMVPLVSRIDWRNLEEAIPAFMTILCMPLTYGIVHGVAAGVLFHVLVQAAMGKWRSVHPMLYLIAAIFIMVIVAETRV